MKQLLPVARSKNLIVKELSDETLIYDLDSDKAHCLNRTAAVVWKNSDGNTSVSQLRELIEKETDFAVPTEVVWLALDQLERFNLLEVAPTGPARQTGMDRRQLVRRIGVAALALPVIISITAPTARAQASNCFNDPCNSPLECCPTSPICGPSNKCKN